MDLLNPILEILKYVLPAGLVLLGIRLMQQQRLKEVAADDQRQWRQQIAKEQSSLLFHAYERALLFLSRIEPDQLLSRIPPQNIPAAQYARILDSSIKEEFEHNLAQQLYIVPSTWEQVLKTQIVVRSMIKEALQTLPKEASAMDLYQKIWESWTNQQEPVTLPASLVLKRDVQGLLFSGKIPEA